MYIDHSSKGGGGGAEGLTHSFARFCVGLVTLTPPIKKVSHVELAVPPTSYLTAQLVRLL